MEDRSRQGNCPPDDTVTIDSGYHFNVKPGDAATSLPRFWLLLVWRRAVTSRE
ncbi:hypothetical protein GS491_23510 [Rhodococcus hoagii]|nr:hypothetical protein [Prescottella equi]